MARDRLPAPNSVARLREIARVLGLLLGFNVLVAAAKLTYGLQSGAIAIAADGLHSVLDSASNVIGLIGASVASKPADADHPYGHRKYETLATLAVAGILFLGCWHILGSAWHRFREPTAPTIGPEAFAVMAVTLVINVFVALYEWRRGRELRSELLKADAAHTASDIIASLLVIGSLVATRAGIGWADAAAAVLVVAFVLRAGASILVSTLSTLSDERRLPPLQVQTEAMKESGVLEVHNVRSRGSLDDIHLDLHILVDPDTPLALAHATAHRVERRLRDVWPSVTDVVVHVEPALAEERARVGAEGALEAEN